MQKPKKWTAVRKCLDDEEIRRAVDTGKIIRSRWILTCLTWKPTPPDEIETAKKEAKELPHTVLTSDGSKEAKARIVLLGFQHPSLLDRQFKTAAPVQSMVGRNLLYLLATHHPWPIHSLDLATAFLQTQPTEADQEIWTTGVAELRAALGLQNQASCESCGTSRFNNCSPWTLAGPAQKAHWTWSCADSW